MRAPENLKGHMEPWLKKEVRSSSLYNDSQNDSLSHQMLPQIPRDRVQYEGSYEVVRMNL